MSSISHRKMKVIVVFGFILICCHARTMKTNDQFANNMMEDALNKLKTMLRTGNEKLGIPVLDPFHADHLAINVNENTVKLDTNLTKVNANGLSEYDIINADLKMGKDIVMSFHLSWPLLVANTTYALKGKIDTFEIFGNGDMKLAAQYFALNTTISFLWDGNLNSHLKVKEMKLNLSLKKLDFQVTGLFNDQEISTTLSAIISDKAPEIIKDDTITSKITELVTKKLDDFLSTKTVLEIIQMIL